jgi:hypothetical protein
LVFNRPTLSLTGLLPQCFIPVFEDMPREIHFPKLLVVIDGKSSNAADSHRNVPPPVSFPFTRSRLMKIMGTIVPFKRKLNKGGMVISLR